MCSIDEILSSLNDHVNLAKILKENSQLALSDSIFVDISIYFLSQPVTFEGLSAQRNLYGRLRSSPLIQCELDLFLLNIKKCLYSENRVINKVFLQYLHNISRLLPTAFRDLSYMCGLICLPNGNKNILACILCAYLQQNSFDTVRYDLVINGLYSQEVENDDTSWIDQLADILIENDKFWLRKYYLEEMYSPEILNVIDAHNQNDFFSTKIIREHSKSLSPINIKQLDLTEITTLSDFHSVLSQYIKENFEKNSIEELSLLNLLSSSNKYPYDLHLLFSCSLISIHNPTNYSLSTIHLFRRLILLTNNYYIHQQDLFDDNKYRLNIVYLVAKLLCEFHRRRSKNEHEWYRLYIDVPNNHPLPTFDVFSDVLCLLSTLCFNNNDCQNQVRHVSGAIESILSMTQIDLNQPKAQACVTWLIKCLTENNEENRNYIKQIQ